MQRKFAIVLIYDGGSHRGFEVAAEYSGMAVKKLLDNLMQRPSIGNASHAAYIRSIECSEILYPKEDIIR